MSLTEVKYQIAKDQAIYASKVKKGCFVTSKYEADFILKVAAELGLKLKIINGSSYGFIIKK